MTLQEIAQHRITGIINGMRRSGVDTRDYEDVVAYLEIQLPNMHRAMRERILEQLGISVPTHTRNPAGHQSSSIKRGSAVEAIDKVRLENSSRYVQPGTTGKITGMLNIPGFGRLNQSYVIRWDDGQGESTVATFNILKKVRVVDHHAPNPPISSKELTALEYAIELTRQRLAILKATNGRDHEAAVAEARLEALKSVRDKHTS